MLTRISERFYQWAKGWLVLTLLVLDGFFSGFLLPLVQGVMQGDAGGIQPLDLMFFATPEKLFGMIETYGEYIRPFYRSIELTVDIAYPIVYLFFFGLTISWFFSARLCAGQPDAKVQHRSTRRVVL